MTVGRLLRVARQRIRTLFQPRQVDTELERELAFHLDALTQEKIADGLMPEAARAAARREFGNPTLLAELSRDHRRSRWFHDLCQVLMYALHTLQRERAFATVAVLTLALAIGANAAVIRAVDTVMFEGLRLPHAGRLVSIKSVPLQNRTELHGATLTEAVAWRDRTAVFESFGIALPWESDFGTDGSGPPPERIAGLAVSRGWFETLGVAPALGRVFNEVDERRTRPDDAVVVISDTLWHRRFNGDHGILGARIRLDQALKTVVGVMPPEFRYQDRRIEFWLLQRTALTPRPSVQRFYGVIARLTPEATLAGATRELEAVASGLSAETPHLHGGWTVRVLTLHDALYAWTAAPLAALQAAAIIVLLIACVNLASLQLARSTRRRLPLVREKDPLQRGEGLEAQRHATERRANSKETADARLHEVQPGRGGDAVSRDIGRLPRGVPEREAELEADVPVAGEEAAEPHVAAVALNRAVHEPSTVDGDASVPVDEDALKGAPRRLHERGERTDGGKHGD